MTHYSMRNVPQKKKENGLFCLKRKLNTKENLFNQYENLEPGMLFIYVKCHFKWAIVQEVRGSTGQPTKYFKRYNKCYCV